MKRPGHLLTTVCGALIAALLVAGCKKPIADHVLAKVGDREIQVEELAARMRTMQPGSPVPLDPRRMLDEMIEREILMQSARQAGLESDPEVRELIRDVLAAKLKERKLAPQFEAATVSEAEVKAAYETSAAEFTTPEKVHLAVLFLQAPAEGDQAVVARQKLETARSRVQQVSLSGAANFGPLAVEFSEDQETRYRGGDLGWIERGRYPQRIEPAVIDAGFALREPGAFSGVIRGKHGYYVVKLLERHAPAVMSLESVAPTIGARLLREKREKIETQFLAGLRATVPVEVHPERLSAVPAAGSSAADLPPKLP